VRTEVPEPEEAGPFPIGVGRDVTERKQIEESLRLTQLSVDRAADLVHWVACDGRLVYANDSSCRRFGYSHEEILTRTVFDLDPTMTPEGWPEHWQELKRCGSMTFESVHRTKEGQLYPVEVTLNYFGSGGEEYIVAFARDVTERKQGEDAFRESEERYRTLFENMLEGFAYCQMLLDEGDRPVDFVYLAVNPAFEWLTGLRDVVGRRVTAIIPGIKEEAPELFEIYGRVASSGRPERFEIDFTPLSKWLDVAVSSPGTGYFVAVFQDITERKLAEAERETLREKEQELAEELAAQNEELRAAQAETARLLEERGSLVRRLQEALLDIPQELPGVKFAHLYRSATREAQVGGDFYDVFEAKQGRIGLLIGDVCGHGVEAARVATLVKDTVHAFAHQFRRPHVVLREANRLLVEKRLPGFVTAFLGFLDPESGMFTYSSAGHPAPLLATDGQIGLLQSIGLPLGVFPDERYRDTETEIQEGSLLLLYTDGVTEARLNGDIFGEERLAEALGRVRDRPLEMLPSLLLDEALGFSGGRLEDDAALLAVNYLGKLGGKRPSGREQA